MDFDTFDLTLFSFCLFIGQNYNENTLTLTPGHEQLTDSAVLWPCDLLQNGHPAWMFISEINFVFACAFINYAEQMFRTLFWNSYSDPATIQPLWIVRRNWTVKGLWPQRGITTWPIKKHSQDHKSNWLGIKLTFKTRCSKSKSMWGMQGQRKLESLLFPSAFMKNNMVV